MSDPGICEAQVPPVVPNIADTVQSCDLIDTESDSGIESMNSLSPQDSPAPAHMITVPGGALMSPAAPVSSPPSSPPTPSSLHLPPPPPLTPATSMQLKSKFIPASNSSLSLSSIHAMLPDTPLDIRDLDIAASTQESQTGRDPALDNNSSYLSDIKLVPEYLDSGEMMAVPPLLIKKDNTDPKAGASKKDIIKKPSLLSCLLSIPPVETKAAKQLSSLLSQQLTNSQMKTKHASPVDIVNFINSSKLVSDAAGITFDSFKQKDNGRLETELNLVPSLENELMGIKYNMDTDGPGPAPHHPSVETQMRKKLIINKRKKELINVTGRI